MDDQVLIHEMGIITLSPPWACVSSQCRPFPQPRGWQTVALWLCIHNTLLGTAVPTCVCVVFGCLCALVTESSSCNRDHMTCRSLSYFFFFPVLSQNKLPSLPWPSAQEVCRALGPSLPTLTVLAQTCALGDEVAF